MIDAKKFIQEITELITDNKLTKLNAAAFIGQCDLLIQEDVLTFADGEQLIKKIKSAANMTSEEVDEALFYTRAK